MTRNDITVNYFQNILLKDSAFDYNYVSTCCFNKEMWPNIDVFVDANLHDLQESMAPIGSLTNLGI